MATEYYYPADGQYYGQANYDYGYQQPEATLCYDYGTSYDVNYGYLIDGRAPPAITPPPPPPSSSSASSAAPYVMQQCHYENYTTTEEGHFYGNYSAYWWGW